MTQRDGTKESVINPHLPRNKEQYEELRIIDQKYKRENYKNYLK